MKVLFSPRAPMPRQGIVGPAAEASEDGADTTSLDRRRSPVIAIISELWSGKEQDERLERRRSTPLGAE